MDKLLEGMTEEQVFNAVLRLREEGKDKLADKLFKKYDKLFPSRDRTFQLEEVEEVTPPKSRPKPKQKVTPPKSRPEMAYGGMANGKKHMYLAPGGVVKDNPGLLALRNSGDKGKEAFMRITKGKKVE
tara:strand:- start:470 stop:853 length:384 start_codon:yes stop_codon:yes gene_type:complete